MPRPRHASSHVNDTQKMTLDLGAKAIGTETCKLGANCHGAEVRVYFLKGYCQGRICENLSKKRAEKQKNRWLLLETSFSPVWVTFLLCTPME